MAFLGLSVFILASHSPVTKTYPSSMYWGIDGSFRYGDATIMTAGSGIVDTGTTLIYLSSGK